MCRYLWFYLTINLIATSVFSQSVYGGFDKLKKQDDFYHTRISAVFQDSHGYLWVGTTKGVKRFDGASVDSFTKMDDESDGLGDNIIHCIDEDVENGIYWAGTSIGGVSRLDIEKYDYQYYYIEPDSSNVVGIVQVDAVCCIDSEKILVGTDLQGLYYFYPQKNEFIPFQSVCNVDFKLSKSILHIKKGKNFIWVVTPYYIMKFNQKGDYLQTFFFNGEEFQLKEIEANQKINYLIEKNEECVLFTSQNSLYQYNWSEKKITTLFTAPKAYSLNFIQVDNFGGYWLGSKANGLIYFNPSTNEISFYKENSEVKSIPNNSITSLLLVQNNSILWIGTNRGMVKYDYHKSKFKQFDIGQLSNQKVDAVFTLLKDSQDGYWLRSKDGFYHKGSKDSVFQKLLDDKQFRVYNGLESKDNSIWLTTDKGLLNYSLDSKRYDEHKLKLEGINQKRLNFIGNILPYRDSKVFLLTRSGIILYDINTHAYEPFCLFKNQNLQYYFTSMILNKDSSALWVANRRGELRKIDLKERKCCIFDIRKILNKANRPCIILDMKMDEEGLIWLGTYGGGLLIYDPEKNTISDELAYNMLDCYVYGILPDDNGNFWISTNSSICKVHSESKEIEYFGEKDGTLCTEFNDHAFFKTNNGTLLFGGEGGFVEFHPDSIYKNDYHADVYIAAMLLENNSVEFDDAIWQQVTYLKDTVVNIKGLKSSIKFFASMIDYSRSREGKIKWKLDGFDDDWNIDNVNNVIKYNNLKEGSYVLNVKGINHDGTETRNIARLHININAYFFNSFRFKIILVIVIAFIIYLIIRMRFVWYNKQEERLLHKVDEKTRELKDANEELELIQETLINQKTELEIHRNYLEDIVMVRTQDLVKAKAKAEESDRLKTAFLANLSHEIRTPMNAIIGFSSLLQNDEFDTEQRNQYLKVINQSSETLLVLINDIIDISRIETNNVEIIKKKTCLRDLVQETLQELVFEDKSEGVNIVQVFEIESKDETIIVDRYRLKQILSNLLRNAFKFTEEGYVRLTVQSGDKNLLENMGFEMSEKEDGEFHPVIFIIEDTGIGIDESNIELIFEPFQKAPNNIQYYKGMGLGLSIVKNLVKLFGGEIMVQSEVGEGSMFLFYIDTCVIRNL